MAHPRLHQRPARLALLAGFLFPALTLNAARFAPLADDTPTEPSAETPTPSSDTPIPTDTPTPSDTPPPTETLAPTPTFLETPTDTDTSTATSTPTETPTLTASAPPPTSYPALSVLINEVAWAGTWASPSDEWIELFNPGASAIDLSGWSLTDGNDIDVLLSGVIPPFSYFLLEQAVDSMPLGGME